MSQSIETLDTLLGECGVNFTTPTKTKKQLTPEEIEERRLARNEASRKSKAKDRADLKQYRTVVPKMTKLLQAYIEKYGDELAQEIKQSFN